MFQTPLPFNLSADFQGGHIACVRVDQSNGQALLLGIVDCQRQPENADFRRNRMSFFAGQHAVGIQP